MHRSLESFKTLEIPHFTILSIPKPNKRVILDNKNHTWCQATIVSPTVDSVAEMVEELRW